MRCTHLYPAPTPTLAPKKCVCTVSGSETSYPLAALATSDTPTSFSSNDVWLYMYFGATQNFRICPHSIEKYAGTSTSQREKSPSCTYSSTLITGLSKKYFDPASPIAKS